MDIVTPFLVLVIGEEKEAQSPDCFSFPLQQKSGNFTVFFVTPCYRNAPHERTECDVTKCCEPDDD
jgi:hypothetical protein